MFDIYFTGEYCREKFTKFAVGKIIINDFEETFYSNIHYWSPKDYKDQWLYAIKTVTEQKRTSALIVWMAYPKLTKYIICWPLYSIDNNKIAIQERWLFMKGIRKKFSIQNLDQLLGKREVFNEDGEKISEWQIDRKDLLEYIKSR